MVRAVCGYCKLTFESEPFYPLRDIFGNEYSLVRCPACRAISLHPRPGGEALKRAYDDTYYGQEEKKFTFPLIENVLDWFRGGRARKLSRYVRDGDSVLDIGCGNGNFLSSLLRVKKVKAYGVELEGNSARRAMQIPGLVLKVGVLEKGDFQARSLKAVTMFHVFEHLTEPIFTLDLIDEILCQDGILMVSFPNIDSWQCHLFKGRWLHLDPPRHLFFLAPSDFISLMHDRGYRLLREHYASMEQNPFGMVQSVLNLFTSRRDLLFESLKGNSGYLSGYPKWKIIFQKIFFFLGMPLFIMTNVVAATYRKGATVEFIFQKFNNS